MYLNFRLMRLITYKYFPPYGVTTQLAALAALADLAGRLTGWPRYLQAGFESSVLY